MKKFIPILLLVIISNGFNSCSTDDNNGINVQFKKLNIVQVHVPEKFDFGSTYEIQATFVRPDGCTYFQGFDVYPTDTADREVISVGARYEDQACTQQIIEVTESFLFKVVHNQTYTFRFYSGQDEGGNPEYIERQVPVN